MSENQKVSSCAAKQKGQGYLSSMYDDLGCDASASTEYVLKRIEEAKLAGKNSVETLAVWGQWGHVMREPGSH